MKKACLLLLISLVVCSCEKVKLSEEKVIVSRVMMHRPGDYTIFTVEGNTMVRRSFESKVCSVSREPVIYLDVPQGSPMWAIIEAWKDEDCGMMNIKVLSEIHLNTPQQIEGGAWDEKVGKGSYRTNQTIPIQ